MLRWAVNHEIYSSIHAFPIHATTSRVTDYHLLNVTAGVSLVGNGAVIAGVIWASKQSRARPTITWRSGG